METSPGNFQAWLQHGQVLDEATSTRVAKELALRFGGDPGSADWRHFGRLAGFTNPKPNRRLESGLQPFARLVEASGQVYIRAAAFIAEVRAAMAAAVVSETGGVGDGAGQGAPESLLRSLAEFHRDPRYAGDLHRADMAWARHAAAMGLSAAEIRAELMRARDLSKKGNLKRQREYAERTAGKAVQAGRVGECRAAVPENSGTITQEQYEEGTMPAVLKKLEDEAMRLPARARARLAERLLASLDEEPTDPDAERLWAAEAERRAEELASGRVKGIPADKVLRKARAALR